MRKNYNSSIMRVITYDLASILYCGCCVKQPAEGGSGCGTREPLWRIRGQRKKELYTILSKVQSLGVITLRVLYMQVR